jgi:hypothetical protein
MIRAISTAIMQAYEEKPTLVPRFPGNIREQEKIIEYTYYTHSRPVYFYSCVPFHLTLPSCLQKSWRKKFDTISLNIQMVFETHFFFKRMVRNLLNNSLLKSLVQNNDRKKHRKLGKIGVV